MDEAVPNAKLRMSSQNPEGVTDFDHGDPLFVKTSLNERLTVIAVDPQIRTPSGSFYDVMYVGSTKGKVLKVISAVEDKEASSRHPKRKPVIIEEIQVFPQHVAVRNIQVLSQKAETDNGKKLIVLSDYEVKSLPLHRCSAVQVQSCSACVALQDPHCAWNLQAGKCVDHSTYGDTDLSMLIQDVYHGKHQGCSSEPEPVQSSSFVMNRAEEFEVSEDPTSQPTKMIDIVIDIDEEQENEALMNYGNCLDYFYVLDFSLS